MTAKSTGARRRTGPRGLAVLVLAGAAVTISSCTGTGGEVRPSAEPGGVDAQPGSGEPAPAPTSNGEGDAAGPDGAAPGDPVTDGPSQPGASGPAPADIAASVDAALRALGEAQDTVTRDQVRSAVEQGFVEAGAAPEALEVSIDRTPTGLDVDAIQGSGLISGQCIVGEIREGAVSVAVLPVLATGLCFVGDQR